MKALDQFTNSLNWSRAKSLWYYPVHTGCCADELLESLGCRYDLERFGCVAQMDPGQADLLIVSGAINRKLSPRLRDLYRAMPAPRYVLAIGACACRGGAFGQKPNDAGVVSVEEIIPVDVFVPGCPPRPEAIMNGLIALQEKILRGSNQN